ncbi:MAG: hypothetical protein Kow00129_15990 [Thermoleophilia bacterium]
MRHEDLKISNLETEEQVQQIRDIICGITGARFVSADLEDQIIEFDMFQDFDHLDITTIQCTLREHGFEAGEVVEGQTCTLRFRES